MKEYTLQTDLWLPRALDEIFPFFSEARNLQQITPPWLHFEVLTPEPIEMKAGTLIDYRIRIHGIPIRWRTEIAEWDPPHRFIDVQLWGPYRLWHHTHTFEADGTGTRCKDYVRYHPWGGALINWLFVRRDVDAIFEYRQKRLLELFPE
ncbi:CDP-paratose 2-epimerase [Verrucomicrobia bacterium LW23]|nr:CDP-paratose 2-epimerase [Verrucomicrobia bacterium LW23]